MHAEMTPKISTIKYASEIFNVNPLWLMGYDVPKKRKIEETDINKHYYMTPVYRSNLSRTTQLGRRKHRRQNTNRRKFDGYSKSRGAFFLACEWRKHEQSNKEWCFCINS